MRTDRLYKRCGWLRSTLILSVGSLLLGSLGAGWPRVEADGDTTAGRAKALASWATGVPEQALRVVGAAPLGDSGIRRFKLVDDQGDIHGVDVDAAGTPVSRDVVEQAALETDRQGFAGKLEAELADRLNEGQTGQINAVYWLRGATPEPLRGDDVSPMAYEARVAAIRARVAGIQRPFVDHIRARGHQVIYQSHHVPAVVAAASAAEIRAVEARPEVERIYLERVHRPRLDVSRIVVQASIVNGRGFTGVGEKVAVVEAGRIGSHANLPSARRILCRPGASSSTSDHKTSVAGVIQSTHATIRGMAPSITLIDAIGRDFSDAEMMAATDCAIAQGASAINMSFGSETNGVFDAFARFVDLTAHRTGRTMIVAISNFCDNRMGSPEIAFNAVAVGAFWDNNTTGFADDVPPCTGDVPFSAYRDPLSPHGDREEPDVVAPGRDIQTTTSGDDFSDVTGTSFAAPHVTGSVGLLHDRRSALHNQNELVRAILMASARHNLEGASRLSERDGAGGIMLAAADRTLARTQAWFFTRPGVIFGFPVEQAFSVSAGERVRVATAWSHKSGVGRQPSTDLDLLVFDPSGRLVGVSASFDNSYEIVQFIALVGGTYKARIANSRPSPGVEFIGIAVSRSNT